MENYNEPKIKIEKGVRLYIVRHGETEWNVLHKFQGQLNSSLTKNGIKVLENTGEKLKNIKFKEIYTSYLDRTIESAKIILQKNINYKKNKIEIKKMPELNEVYFGLWQGMSHKDVFKKFPEEANNYFYDVKRYKAENIKGENLKEALNRFLSGINKILENKNTGNILVVTHGTVFEMFMNYIKNIDIFNINERKLINNGDYRIFKYENNKITMIED